MGNSLPSQLPNKFSLLPPSQTQEALFNTSLLICYIAGKGEKLGQCVDSQPELFSQ